MTTAMGYTPGSFSCRGLTQGLPVGYGRFIGSSLVALSLRQNLGMPYMSSSEFKEQWGTAEALTAWAEKGYHPRGTPTWVDPDLAANSQPLMVITEQQAAVLLQRQYRCTHESLPAVATPTRKPSLSPWQVTREVQMKDPYLRRIISSLEAKPVELESWAIPRRAIARVHR